MEKKIIARNKKAYHDYFIEDTYEAGIALKGTEVKSIRQGKVNLKDSYARVEKGRVIVLNMHISPYSHGNIYNHDPLRPRQLLLRKNEIRKLIGKTQEKGYTLIPLQLYFKDNYAKLELGLAKGKRQYDKRREIAEKTAKREIERALRMKQKKS